MRNQGQRQDYWAASPPDEIASEIQQQFDEYLNWCDSSGYADKILRNYNAYYGRGVKGAHGILKSDDGSITNMSVNHHRSLLKNVKSLVVQNKLAFDAKAKNTDYQARTQTQLASGLLQWYQDEKNLNDVFSNSVEAALVFNEAFLECPWDQFSGVEVRPDETGRIIKAGDQRFYIHNPFDVARDVVITEESDWKICRRKVNRFNLAALYPHLADAIIAASANRNYKNWFKDFGTNGGLFSNSTDAVELLTLYHGKSEVLPQGRLTIVCGDTVLEDGPLPYKKSPVFRMSAGDVFESIAGHSPGLDLLSMQEVMNALFSAVATNNLNLAITNIWSQTAVDVHEISKGMNNIVCPQPPQSLNLANSSGETYKLLDMLVNHQQLISGMNATIRGDNVGTELKSGNALALMSAQAIQFVNDLSRSYASFVSDVGTCIIHNVQQFAQAGLIAKIGGKSKSSYVKDFQPHEIDQVDTVSVDLGNGVTNTISGRINLADSMLQAGLIKTPQAYLSVYTTGNLETAIEPDVTEQNLMVEENELIKQGQNPPVTLLDVHPAHIMAHKSVFSDPSMRSNPQVMDAALAHIQDHINDYNQLTQMNPDLAAILGMSPLPSSQVPPGAPPPGAPQQEVPPKPLNLPPGAPKVAGVGIASPPPNAPQSIQDASQEQQSALAANQGPL